MERLRSMVITFDRSAWLRCVKAWPLYHRIAHCSLGPSVIICESLIFFFFYNHVSQNVYRDPQGLRTDAELISSLQRSWLLPKDGRPDPAAEAKFSLDSIVGDDG